MDVDALRQWETTPLPADRSEWPALMNQIRMDMSAAVDYIVELETRLGTLGAKAKRSGK